MILDCAGYESRLDQLTPRQRQVAEMLVAGEKMIVIAVELGIGLDTVRNHIKQMCARVGLSTIARPAVTAWLVTGVKR